MTKWERLVVLVMALVVIALMVESVFIDSKRNDIPDITHDDVVQECYEAWSDVGMKWFEYYLKDNVDEIAYNLIGAESN